MVGQRARDTLEPLSDGGIQALCSLNSPCLTGLLGCLSAMLAPRVGKMGNICTPSPLSVTPRGGRAFYNTIQYNTILYYTLLTMIQVYAVGQWATVCWVYWSNLTQLGLGIKGGKRQRFRLYSKAARQRADIAYLLGHAKCSLRISCPLQVNIRS